MPDITLLIELLAFGFVVAGLIHISGVGAGVLLVPSLMVVFKLSPMQAVGTASLFTVLFRLGSILSIWRTGQLQWPVIKTFMLYALPATAISAVLAGFAPKWYPEFRGLIEATLRGLVLVACVIALVSIYSESLKSAMRKLGVNGLAIVAGFFLGSSGVGGGVLIVPALLSIGTLTATQAIASSGLIAMVLTASSGLLYALSGSVQWLYLVCMLIGGYASLPLAIWVQKKLSQKTLVDIVASLIGVSLLGLVIQWFV